MTPWHSDPRIVRLLLRTQELIAGADWHRARSTAEKTLAAAGQLPIARLQHSLSVTMADRATWPGPVRDALTAIPELVDYRMLDEALRSTGGWSPVTSLINAMATYIGFHTIDRFILEYPKCGRTWLRQMVGMAIDRAMGRASPDPGELMKVTLAAGLPTIELTHDDSPHVKPADAIATDKSLYSGKKVVLLVRDPRDVVVSYFFHVTKRGDAAGSIQPFTGTLAEFFARPAGGLASVIRYYNVWAAARTVPRGFLRVRYEDLRADTPATLAEVLTFLDIPVPDAAGLQKIVESCRFDAMQAEERAGRFGVHRLTAGDAGEPDSYKVRRGKIGGFRDYLDAGEIARIDQEIARDLDDWYGDYKRPTAPR